MVKDSVVHGCKTLASYVVQRGKILPQWVIAAFWWESIAAQGEMSGKTSRSSSRVGKIVSKCGIVVDGAGYEPPQCASARARRSASLVVLYSDLWHSGALEEQTNTISRMLNLSSTRLVPGGHKGHGRLPSAVQAGIAKYVSREPDEN
ncbi:MAG: hypothetical protein ABSB21_03765 [Halobacteriota archaeon]